MVPERLLRMSLTNGSGGFQREEQDHVNHSAYNTCGRGGPRRPCAYDIENRLGLVRLAIIRRLGP